MRTRSNCSATSNRSAGVAYSQLGTGLTLEKHDALDWVLFCGSAASASNGPIAASLFQTTGNFWLMFLENPYTNKLSRQRKSTKKMRKICSIRHLGNIY